MGQIQISADVDAEECLELCETKYIVAELVERIGKEQRREKNKVTPDQKRELKKDLLELIHELGIEEEGAQLKIVSIADDMKLAHIRNVFDKYTLDQMELLLPL